MMTLEQDDSISGVVVPNRSWQDNADEFGLHESGWRLMLLVACSVIPSDGQGDRTDLCEISQKSHASFNEFGKRAGKDRQTIANYYETWQYAASLNMVPDATTLNPDDAGTVDITSLDRAQLKQVRRELSDEKERLRLERQPEPAPLPPSGGSYNPPEYPDPPRSPKPYESPIDKGITPTPPSPDDWKPDTRTSHGEAQSRVLGALAKANAGMIEALAFKDQLSSEMAVRAGMDEFFRYVEQMVLSYGGYLNNGN